MTEHVEQPGAGATPIPASLRGWLGDRRAPLLWWAASRLAVFATALGLYAVGGRQGYFNRSVLTHPLGILSSWDGKWYRLVAEHGYLLVGNRQSDPAFFPGFPLLLSLAHSAGVPVDLAGIAIANLAFLGALLAFHELSLTVLPRPDADRATAALAIFPVGFVFSMSYPQSLVLLAITLAPLLALRRRWLAVAAVAGFGALCRPEALFVVVPLAGIAWSQRRRLRPTERAAALAALAAPVAALVSYVLYLGWLLDDPMAWSQAQLAWGRQFSVAGAFHALGQIPSLVGQNPWLVRDVVSLAVYFALLAYGLHRGLPRTWLAAGLLIVLLPLFSGTVVSEARFGLVVPPLYWAIAVALRRRRDRKLAAATALILLIVCTATLPNVFP